MNDTQRLKPFLDGRERGELAVGEGQAASKGGSALPGAQMWSPQGASYGSLRGFEPRTQPKTVRGLRLLEGGRKVEQGTNVDEALLREPQTKRAEPRRRQKQNLNKKPPPVAD